MSVVTLGRDTIATNMVFIVHALVDNDTFKIFFIGRTSADFAGFHIQHLHYIYRPF